MQYQFCGALHKEGNRTFIPIPFNVWEETGLKGNIPCRVHIQDQCMVRMALDLKLVKEETV